MASIFGLNDERYEPLITLLRSLMNVTDIERSLTSMQKFMNVTLMNINEHQLMLNVR